MKILFLAGGSGGHILPAVAIATEFQKKHPEAKIGFICSRSKLDQEILLKNLKFKIHNSKFIYPIFTGKLRRYFSWQNFIDPFLLIFGFFQSFFILFKFKPDVVFSKGGFVSLSPAFAAYLLKIPVVAHESDAVPGLANRMVRKFCKKIFTAFPSENSKDQWVGLPIRREILEADKEKGREFLGIKNEKLKNNITGWHNTILKNKPLLFGFFGSQGSEFMNKIFDQNKKEISQIANVAWVTGKGKNVIAIGNCPSNTKLFPFLHQEFPDILAAADIVISRSGSGIFEIAAAKKPSLLIPLPTSAGDHQVKNAKEFSKKNAALVLTQKELEEKPEKLFEVIKELIADTKKQKELSENISQFSKKDVTKKIVEYLEKFTDKKHED